MKTSKNIEKFENMFFRTLRKLDFGGFLGVGSAAKVAQKRFRKTSGENKSMLIFLDNSIGKDLQKY